MMSFRLRGNIISASVTFSFFIALLLSCIFVKGKEKTVYKTMQIQLASSVTPSKALSSAAEPLAESKENITQEKTQQNIEETPVAQKKSEPEVKKSETVQSVKETVQNTQSSSSAPAKTNYVNRPKIRKSDEEIMAELAAKKAAAKKDAEFIETQETDYSSRFESSQIEKKATVQSSLSGSAGSVSQVQENQTVVSSSAKTPEKQLSENTKSALSEIVQNRSYKSSSDSNNVGTQTSIKSSSSEGKVSIQMSDGRLRQLITPKTPEIHLSEASTVMIQKDIHVNITFSILADGSVPMGEIYFSPASSLPYQVQQEVRQIMMQWSFSQDPSGSKGSASFDFYINVR